MVVSNHPEISMAVVVVAQAPILCDKEALVAAAVVADFEDLEDHLVAAVAVLDNVVLVHKEIASEVAVAVAADFVLDRTEDREIAEVQIKPSRRRAASRQRTTA